MRDRIRVLFIDDDQGFRRSVSKNLIRRGLEVVDLEDAIGLEDKIADIQPDVIVLDIILPKVDGFEALRNIREHGYQGIVILMTVKSKLKDRIIGLENGADYYLPKPVDMRELFLIIQNLTHRLRLPTGQGSVPKSEIWLLDSQRFTLKTPNKNVINLTGTQTFILKLLMEKPGIPVRRELISQSMGKEYISPDDRSVDVQVSRLRRILPANQQELPIKSVRNIGYVFTGVAAIE